MSDLEKRVEEELLKRNGPRCAAALVGKGNIRRILHRRGQVQILLPAECDDKRREMIQYGIEWLNRSTRWGVVVYRHMGMTRYLVRWNEWTGWVAQSAFVGPNAIRRARPS